MTEDQCLYAIWDNRLDIQDAYNTNWGAGLFDPRLAIRDWLVVTTESDVIGCNRDACCLVELYDWQPRVRLNIPTVVWVVAGVAVGVVVAKYV